MANYNLPVIDKFSWQPPVKDKDRTAPPGSESKGDRYIVKAAAAGDWAGEATHIAMAKQANCSDPSHWIFATPAEGWMTWVEDENQFYYFDGTDWIAEVDFSFVNAALSSMILTGGEISEGTDPGTIKVAALTAMLRTGSGTSDPLVKISLGVQDNITLAAKDIWYKVRLTYGTPSCTIATSISDGNGANIIGIGHCLKEDDGTRHFSDAGLRLSDGVRKLHNRASTLREIEISSGGLVSDPGTRHLQITAGIFYRGINKYETSIFDSSSSGYDFEYYYWNPTGEGAWVKDVGGPYTQIDNANYNLATGEGTGKEALGTNKYTTNWVFMHPDDEHVLVLYGRSHTSLTEAENEEIPASLPDILDEMAALLCKVIVQQGSSDLIFENVKYFTFTPQVVVDHNELSGLQGGQAGEYEHLTSAEQTVAADLLTTKATAAELDELTDGSETVLHSHADPDKAFTDLTDVDEASIESADIGKVVKVGDDLKLEFAEDISGGAGVETLLSFTPQCNEPPASNFATLDTRNNHPVLDFNDTTNESAVFRGIMPNHYTGDGVTVVLHYAMTSAEANTVDWDVAFERIGDQQLDIDGDSFAAVNSVDNTTVPGTTGLVDVVSITFTNGEDMDSIAAGEAFRIKVTRDAASDDATGDAELLFVEIKETP